MYACGKCGILVTFIAKQVSDTSSRVGAVPAIISLSRLGLPGRAGGALRLSDEVPPYLSQLSLRP